jgi:hypothetical protein
MKQTAAVSLGILGLNENFARVNDIINFLYFILKKRPEGCSYGKRYWYNL